MHNSVAKKIFAVGIAASTALLGFAPLASATAHTAGTNIKSSDGTVWMITASGTRRAYTSAGAFLSFGYNSFSTVVDANADDLALPVDPAGFIPPQDGSIICSDRGSDKGTCYLITGSQKAGFTSAAVFTGRGFTFANSNFGDVSWMTTTSNIDETTSAHRPGVLINDHGTVYLVGAGGKLGIPDLATFNSWGYSFGKVVPANAADMALVQTGVMAARLPGQLNPTALTGGTNPPPSGGSVSASLAADSPAAQTIAVLGSGTAGVTAASSTIATLANFMFTGSGSVTQLQIKRIGVSPDSIINNAYLYSNGTRLTDAASVGGSSLITFNNPSGLFTVNGSMEISVVVEIAGNAASGQTLGLQMTSFTVGTGSASSVSISGNLFTTATASDLATAQFGTVTPSGGAYDPSTGVAVFTSNVTVNQRDMTLSRFIIRNIGTVQQGDLKNFVLRIDGIQIATVASMDANGYVTFSFTPVTLKAGTRQLQVLADIISGSSRNFQFQIRNKADVNFTDTQYNTAVSPNNTFPVGSASSNSINSGTLTIVRAANSPSGNVTDQATNVTLANFTITAYGEPMQIQTLTVGATSSNPSVGSLRNGRLLINGVQYGSTATLATSTGNTYSGGGTSYTLNYTVNPGSPATLSVNADMFDNDAQGNSLANGNTVTALIMVGSSNVQRMVSLGYISSPSAYVIGNAITDVTGSVTLSKNNTYANQTIPQPQTGYLLGSFNLVGSTSEDVNITSVDISLGTSSTSVANLNNVTMKINGNIYGTIKGSVGTTTATSTYSGSVTLLKNTTVPVLIYADIPAVSVANGSDKFIVNVNVNGTAVSSSANVTSPAVGQTISIGSASLTVSQDPSTPVAALVAGNQTKTVAAFKFVTANDAQTVSDITLNIPTNTTVSTLSLWDGSTQVGSNLPGGATTTFSNLNWQIPTNTTKILTVQVAFAPVGVGAGSSGEQVKVQLATYKSAPSSTGAYTTTANGPSGNFFYVYKSIPTITNVALPTGVLSPGGTNTLAKFSISSGGTGTIGWTHLVFTYASSGVTSLTNVALWDADANVQITGTFTASSTALTQTFDTLAEQQITGAKNYVLKATVGGGGTSGNYISTNIANPDTTFSQPQTATVATSTAPSNGATPSFVWSDVSAQSHSLTTADWNLDTLVKNLPTDSQTVVK